MKLAARLAYSRDIRQRWRQISVIAAGFVSTLMVLLSAGVVHAAHGSDERIQRRSPVWATSEQDAQLTVSLRGTFVGIYQFPVVWLQPAAGHEQDPTIVPPGLRRLPGPGEAVLSPGLLAQGFTAKDFGLKATTDVGTGPSGAIGLEGLSTSSEGWIYTRAPQGRSLGEGGALLPLRGYRGVSGERASLETSPLIPTTGTTLLGAAWLGLAPALLLLLAGARAMSTIRDERGETLLRLGITRRKIRLLLGIETASLAALGAVVATLLWVILISRTRELPLTGAILNPDALRFPWWLAVLIALSIVFLACLSAVYGSIGNRSLARSPRQIHTWHALPLLVAVLMMGSSRYVMPESEVSTNLLFGGVILTMASMPLAVPVAVSWFGHRLALSARPWLWLAGRRMSLRAASLSRPAIAVGTLVFLAGGAFAIYGRMMLIEPEPTSDAPLSRFVVDWRDSRPDDLKEIQSKLSNGLHAVPLISHENAPATASFSTCSELAEAVKSLPEKPCLKNSKIDPAFVNTFAALTQLTPVLAAKQIGDTEEVLLLSTQTVTPRTVMENLAGTLPAVNITQIARPKPPAVTVGWLITSWILASLVLSLTLLREIGDRALASLSADSQLRRLGLSKREIMRTQRWTLFTPLAAAIPLGYVSAVAFAILGRNLGFTVDYVGRISLIAVAVGAVAATFLTTAIGIHRRIADNEA